MSCRRILPLLVCSLWLSACGSNAKAPVRSLATTKATAEIVHSSYTVQSGDTLYSIAFRYGLNYRGLAARNNIASPYRILPGQTLVLDDTADAYQEVIKPSTEETIKPPQRQVSGKPEAEQVVEPRAESKPVTKPPVARQKPSTKPQKDSYDSNARVSQWGWPLTASRSYQKRSGHQLYFKVKQGTSVKAVAAGRVVYSGRGLVGYGHLVIIKHNQNLLSAYAFNDKVFVKERQNVALGETIATVGKSPTGQVGLGFEIRLQGKPVNPVRYLPK